MSHQSRPLPVRAHLPHLPARETSNRSILQFVTVCVAGRRSLLARPEIADMLVRVWRQADRWHVGRYMIMPDHVHFFCAPATYPASALKDWMAYWRACCTREWPHSGEKPIWQRDFFDHQMRSGESYTQKWNYVRENPVRANLVADSEAWPYQGELNAVVWHERI